MVWIPRTHGYSILLCLFVTFAQLQPLVARQQPKEVPPLLREAVQGCESRSESHNPIWVRFRVKVFESAELLGHFNRDKSVPKDINWVAEVEFALKGSKQRSWAKRTDLPILWEQEKLFIFNGEVSLAKESQENTYSISKSKESHKIYEWSQPPHTMMKLKDLVRYLRTCLEGSKNVTLARAVDSAGDAGREVFLELRFPKTNKKSQALFLPEHDWFVRKSETYAANGELQDRIYIPEQMTVNGITYPKRGTYELCFPPGKLGTQYDYEVTFLETRASHIPESLFEYKFPKDSVIFDVDQKVFVRRTEIAQTHLEEVIRRIENRRPWGWWLATGIAVALLLGSVFLWVRRHRQRSLKQS
jgi:hypothetical protein